MSSEKNTDTVSSVSNRYFLDLYVINSGFDISFCIFILLPLYFSATKIEFYVGDVPEGTPPSLQHARYTRLG